MVVVVLWHWVFSITQWSPNGRLTMPNPIGEVPMLWTATWLLQIIPVFFFVGGFSNYVGWTGTTGSDRSERAFLTTRLQRILAPVLVFLAIWTVGDIAARLVVSDYPGVWHWGRVVLVPLWFIGVYLGVVLLMPLTARLHRRAPAVTIMLLGAAIALVDIVRFTSGVDGIGYVNGALVFLFAHQLGYFYADGTLTGWNRSRLWMLVAVSFATLVALTSVGPYPRSMVAVAGERFSNLNPPTLAIACLSIFQVGLAMLARPAVTRRLNRRRPWLGVVALNSVVMTIFVWHMTAYVLALGLVQLLGGQLRQQATSQWWLERPMWFALPMLALLPLVAVFGTFELRRLRPASSRTKEPGEQR